VSPAGYLNVRLDRELLATARERAQREDRTIASLARLALRAYLDEDDNDGDRPSIRERTAQDEHATQTATGEGPGAARN
jgi:hypothetical protein